MKKSTRRKLSLFTFFILTFVSIVQGGYPFNIPPAVIEERIDYIPYRKAVKLK